MQKLSLAEQTLAGREFITGLLALNVYCYTCNVIMTTGTAVRKYDGATYTHVNCPKTPLKNVAVHKYGN